MKTPLFRIMAVVLSAVLALALPVPQCAAADDESDTDEIGKRVTAGVLVLLLAVLVIIGFREDMDRRAEAALPVLPKTADPKIFVDSDEVPADGGTMEIATRVGLRMSF